MTSVASTPSNTSCTTTSSTNSVISSHSAESDISGGTNRFREKNYSRNHISSINPAMIASYSSNLHGNYAYTIPFIGSCYPNYPVAAYDVNGSSYGGNNTSSLNSKKSDYVSESNVVISSHGSENSGKIVFLSLCENNFSISVIILLTFLTVDLFIDLIVLITSRNHFSFSQLYLF